MFGIDHTADIHIDHGRLGSINPKTGVDRAWESTTHVWMSICESFRDSETSQALVVSGDTFNAGHPSSEASERVADGLRVATSTGKEVLLLRGNHEDIRLRKGHRGPLERFRDLDNVHVFSDPGTHRLPSGLQVVVMPWPTKHAAVAELDIDLKELDARAVDKAIASHVTKFIETERDRANSKDPVILMGHFTVGNSSLQVTQRGTERDLSNLFSEPIVPASALDGFDYVALGHIHLRQSPTKNAWYPGSPDRINFSETTAAKSWNRVLITEDGTEVEHVPTPARKLAIVDLSDPEDQPDLSTIEGALVRLILPIGMNDVDSGIEKMVAEAGGVVIETKTPQPDILTSPTDINKAFGSLTDNETPAELAERWFDASGQKPEDKKDFMARFEAVMTQGER